MTKPRIPKEIPKERPGRISPGIPVIPKREPDYSPNRGIPNPEKPERVPAYMPDYITGSLDNILIEDMPYRAYRQRVY